MCKRRLDVRGGAVRATPSVSVVVNTVDRADWLARSLDALTRLRYPTYEIVVVAGPCADSTDEVLRRHAGRIRVARWHERNLAAARNKGVEVAAGEIVAFIDDDALAEPDWLDCLVEGFEDPAVGFVGGFVRKPDGRGWEDRIRIANPLGGLKRRGSLPPKLKADEYLSPTGANVAYRRAAIDSVGGFDPEFAYFFEETDLHLRLADAGWRGAVARQAEVHHYRAESSTRDAKSRPRSEYRIARSKAYFVWKHARATHTDIKMEASVRTFVAGRCAWILGLCLQGALPVETTRKLIRELCRGAADGRHAALNAVEPARRPALSAPDRDGRLLAVKRQPGETPMRLCWVAGTDVAGSVHRDRLVQTLAAAGHEVTIIEPATGAEEVVRTEGIWRHRIRPVPFWAGRAARPYEAAVYREFERIQARRGFEMAVAPEGFRAVRSLLNALGLTIFLAPGSDNDLCALEREIRSASRAVA